MMARNMMSNHTDMQDRYCGQCYNIHPIQSLYKRTQKRRCGRRPRHLFCGGGQRPPPLYIGLEIGECRSSDHNTCLACRCDWTLCSVPSGLLFHRRSCHVRKGVPGDFAPCGSGRPSPPGQQQRRWGRRKFFSAGPCKKNARRPSNTLLIPIDPY